MPQIYVIDKRDSWAAVLQNILRRPGTAVIVVVPEGKSLLETYRKLTRAGLSVERGDTARTLRVDKPQQDSDSWA